MLEYLNWTPKDGSRMTYTRTKVYKLCVISQISVKRGILMVKMNIIWINPNFTCVDLFHKVAALGKISECRFLFISAIRRE